MRFHAALRDAEAFSGRRDKEQESTDWTKRPKPICRAMNLWSGPGRFARPSRLPYSGRSHEIGAVLSLLLFLLEPWQCAFFARGGAGTHRARAPSDGS